MAAALPVASEAVAEVKFGQVGIAQLKLKRLDAAALAAELAHKIELAPGLFLHAPLVIDFSHLPQLPELETARELIDRVREIGMLPIALAYGTSENEALARALDLPVLAKFRAAHERQPLAPATDAARIPPEPTAPPPAPPGCGLIHDQPVRSGQQVYARGRDLIVGALVGNGAEVIADGSIHVYGALRGRALAGAQGDTDARIYCREFRAELVSIAGRYRVLEEIEPELRGRAVRVRLDGERLLIERL